MLEKEGNIWIHSMCYQVTCTYSGACWEIFASWKENFVKKNKRFPRYRETLFQETTCLHFPYFAHELSPKIFYLIVVFYFALI